MRRPPFCDEVCSVARPPCGLPPALLVKAVVNLAEGVSEPAGSLSCRSRAEGRRVPWGVGPSLHRTQKEAQKKSASSLIFMGRRQCIGFRV